MKKLFTLVLIMFTGVMFSQIINIPDPVFKDRLIEEDVDTNNDGEIQVSEALAVTDLDISIYAGNPKISNLEGLQFFTNLISLDFSRNLIITFDATTFPNLESLRAYSNLLTSVDLSNSPNLDLLYLSHNQLSSIDISLTPDLYYLSLADNLLTNIDVSLHPQLWFLNLDENQLTAIDVQNNTLLYELVVSDNLLTSLEVSTLNELVNLFCLNNQIDMLDISQLDTLYWLDCSDNLIESINLDGLVNFRALEIRNNNLSEIDGSLSGIEYLSCNDNPNLTHINVQNGVASIPDPDLLYFPLQFENLPNLEFVCIDPADLEALSYSGYDPANVVVAQGPNCSLSVDEISFNNTSIYPNPVKSYFEIDTNENITMHVIYDMIGKILVASSNSQIIKENTLLLKAGVYFLELQTNNNKATFKFIKE